MKVQCIYCHHTIGNSPNYKNECDTCGVQYAFFNGSISYILIPRLLYAIEINLLGNHINLLGNHIKVYYKNHAITQLDLQWVFPSQALKFIYRFHKIMVFS